MLLLLLFAKVVFFTFYYRDVAIIVKKMFSENFSIKTENLLTFVTSEKYQGSVPDWVKKRFFEILLCKADSHGRIQKS